MAIILRFTIIFYFVFFLVFNANSQNHIKQNNTLGSELFADAPYRMQKFDNLGNIAPLPVYIYIHESECIYCNNELAYIDIKLKNAVDASFNQLVLFNNYSQSQFLAIFKNKSVDDYTWGSQSFDNSLPVADIEHTIKFTADTNWWIPPVPIVDITQRYFYFTILIPPEFLQNLTDIFDVEVTFGLDYEVDQYVYSRVFRETTMLPSVPQWYRGDTHYHTYFTQNLAENGLPLDAVKYFAAATGIKWLIATDHSCDFDNYGVSMNDNWNRLGHDVLDLNSQDSSFILIRGMEMSVNNSAGNTVHALVYPNPQGPFSLPYIGDGNGDTQTSSVNISMMLDSLKKYNGFCYAAHPFAEKDVLSIWVNGDVWNLSDTLLPLDGSPHPSMGTVICNDINTSSDIYTFSDSTLFSPNLVGGQLWNMWNALSSADGENNPWDVMNESGITGFTMLDFTDPASHNYRFNQNLDVYKAIIRRGLIMKNQNPTLLNWKFFMEAGSDAHGSFNYSNTCLTYRFGSVSDNAIGRLSTLVYVPQGMGINGSHVLEALQKGHLVLSSGPIITITLTDNNGHEFLPGDDAVFNSSDLLNVFVNFNIVTTPEFGTVNEILLFGGTENGEVSVSLPVFTGTYQISLNSLLQQLWPSGIENDKYFYLRTQLSCIKYYYSLASIYKRNFDIFSSYTNPIWIKISLFSATNENYLSEVSISPNPATDYVYVAFFKPVNEVSQVEVISTDGRVISCPFYFSEQRVKVNVSKLSPGIYNIKVIANKWVLNTWFVKK